MNLRVATVLIVLLIASVANIAKGASAARSIVIPVTLSLPEDSKLVDEAVVRFASPKFQSGFDIDQKIADATVQDPFAIQLSGVRFKTKLHGRLDRDASGLVMEAVAESPIVTIDRIAIHSVIDMRVAGVDASIRIDADCTGSTISWPNQSMALFARAHVTARPDVQIDVSDLALPANLAKPEMKLSCQGPYGIEGMIRDYAWTALQARWKEPSFARELETQIETYFANSVRAAMAGIDLINEPTLKLTVLPKISTDKVTRITLSAPVASLQSLMRAWYTPGVWSNWIDAQTVQGFRDLMSSRFKQFFAFPDLMNYGKRDPFWFAMMTTENPSMKCGSAGVELQLPMGAWLLHQDFKKYLIGFKPMVFFWLPTTVNVAMPDVRTRKLTTARIQSLGLSAAFDARYVKTENPNRSIATGSIRDAVRDYADGFVRDLTKLEGGAGQAVQFLNGTTSTCDPTHQVLQVQF